MKKLKLVKLTPDKPCQVIEIENSLEAFQKEVEGYIEVVRISETEVVIVNEEGKIKNLQPSLNLKFKSGSEILNGNVLFAEVDKQGNFKSLPKKSIEALLDNTFLALFRIFDLT